MEKNQTIGDCYMVAAGVPHPRADHALVATRMALEIQEHMHQHLLQSHSLEFRIGIHSGSAVAEVIGAKEFFRSFRRAGLKPRHRIQPPFPGGCCMINHPSTARHPRVPPSTICGK
jgi:hypothetical protein